MAHGKSPEDFSSVYALIKVAKVVHRQLDPKRPVLQNISVKAGLDGSLQHADGLEKNLDGLVVAISRLPKEEARRELIAALGKIDVEYMIAGLEVFFVMLELEKDPETAILTRLREVLEDFTEARRKRRDRSSAERGRKRKR